MDKEPKYSEEDLFRIALIIFRDTGYQLGWALSDLDAEEKKALENEIKGMLEDAKAEAKQGNDWLWWREVKNNAKV